MRIDWHIHTVLSPCASLKMSPATIIRQAQMSRLDAVGICDHNSTLQVRQMLKENLDLPIKILGGIELCSSEDIHLLAFFDEVQALEELQGWIDSILPVVKNDPNRFGDQVVVDFHGKILCIEDRLLILALPASIGELIEKVHDLGGLAIPAHADKASYSLLSQLGMVPFGFAADAYEVIRDDRGLLRDRPWIVGSDAHYPEHIGRRYTDGALPGLKIDEISQWLRRSENGKYVA